MNFFNSQGGTAAVSLLLGVGLVWYSWTTLRKYRLYEKSGKYEKYIGKFRSFAVSSRPDQLYPILSFETAQGKMLFHDLEDQVPRSDAERQEKLRAMDYALYMDKETGEVLHYRGIGPSAARGLLAAGIADLAFNVWLVLLESGVLH